MRIRKQGDYQAFFTSDYKTLRLTSGKPLTPELTDVAINDKCFANCSYCYTNALKSGNNFERIVEKAEEIWGSLSLNDREFQIAIGGAGEPTLHPDFPAFVKKVRELSILPNYTTNGMHLSDKVLKATEEYCGGVALSYHPHIVKTFAKAVDQLKQINTKLNFHIIVGTDQSFVDLQELFKQYQNVVDYFVVLPYQPVGRAQQINTEEVWKMTFSWIESLSEEVQRKFAFGALFYDFIKNNDVSLDMSIYDPDVYSGYRIFDDDRYLKLYRSSYDLTEIIRDKR